MVTVNIVCVGKLKEKFFLNASDEYIKRLTAFCKINIIEIAPYSLPDSPSKALIDAGLREEGKAILAKIPTSSYVYALCIEGKQRSSEALSAEFDKLFTSGFGNLTFIIGGSFGLSEEVKKRADVRLSMSEMTFPHRLARIMLLEQIYRAFQISSGGKYHK